MVIDGYYVPDDLAHSAQMHANMFQATQHIGVIVNCEPDYHLQCLAASSAYFAAARDSKVVAGRSWVYGPSYDELRRLDDLAAILWITPRRAA